MVWWYYDLTATLVKFMEISSSLVNFGIRVCFSGKRSYIFSMFFFFFFLVCLIIKFNISCSVCFIERRLFRRVLGYKVFIFCWLQSVPWFFTKPLILERAYLALWLVNDWFIEALWKDFGCEGSQTSFACCIGIN